MARDASSAVADFAAIQPDSGTTLTAMLFAGAQFALAHIGDSRAYLLRDDELVQLTHDHTYVQSLVDEGRLSPEEAVSHPKRANLIRALCAGEPAEPDLHLRAARPGDRYLLCSDGVHTVLSEQVMQRVLDNADTPRNAVDELLGLVLEEGAPDNTACVVANV